MIPNQLALPARSVLAATICAFMVSSARAAAQEPAPDSWGDADPPAVERTAARVAVAPRITTLRETPTGPTGSPHATFRVTIRFSENVTFDPAQIQISGAHKGPLTGSGSSYSLTLDTFTDLVGSVFVIVLPGAAVNSRGDASGYRELRIPVDNKPPRIRSSSITGRQVVLTLDENLNERFVPAPAKFSLSFIRDRRYDTKRVSGVEVDRNRMVLTLAEPVLPGDAVELDYRDDGANAARDEVGNRVSGFTGRSISNLTRAGSNVPGPPQDLTATAEDATSIRLVWDEPEEDGGSDITGYRIEVSADAGRNWSDLEANTRNTRTTYTHTGLTAGVTRHYRVRAINPNGEGTPSNVASASTAADRPDAPRGLTARARGTSEIILSWTAPASDGGSDITGYRIEWSRTGTGGWTVLVASTTATTYTDDDLRPNTTRHYRVLAISGAGRSDWSNTDHATTEVDFPGAPTGLRVRPGGVGGSDQLLLTWSAPADDGGSAIVGYRIERSMARFGNWVPLVTNTGSADRAYTDGNLSPATTWFYRVSAINGKGPGPPSSVAEGTTNAAPPGPPQNVRARSTGPHSILLAWDRPEADGGERITGYAIQRIGPNDNNWITHRSNTGTTVTTFTDTGLEPVTRYQYRVAAINRRGRGEWAPSPPDLPATVITHADKAGAPTGLTARAVGTARIDLSWHAPRYTGGVSIIGYRIETSDDGGATWTILRRNTNSTTTTFSDVNLRPATTRHYRVAARNLAGDGAWSNTARATTDATLPGVPRRLSAEAVGTSQITLSWQAPADNGGARITGYRIEVSADGGGSWEDLVGNTRTSATVYPHSGLEPASTRHYRVSAINRIGVGDASRIAGSTTDATVPDAPTGLAANDVSPTQIDLFWVAPAYNGGARITGYRIEVSETGAA